MFIAFCFVFTITKGTVSKILIDPL